MDSAINEWLLQYEHIKEIAEMIHTDRHTRFTKKWCREIRIKICWRKRLV